MKYWLIKSEPLAYSIDDLARDSRTFWDGVRNYQARNFMRDQMQPGDGALFYHSNAEPSGVAGVARVLSGGLADATAWQSGEDHFDPRSTPEKPVWYGVEVGFEEKFPRLVTLEMLRQEPGLSQMLVLKPGQRLSVQPVTAAEWALVCRLGRA